MTTTAWAQQRVRPLEPSKCTVTGSRRTIDAIKSKSEGRVCNEVYEEQSAHLWIEVEITRYPANQTAETNRREYRIIELG